jgi:acyl transferase domain-containing protein
MGSTTDVAEALPGLRFYGVVAELRANRVGTKTGTITMSCEVHDRKLWEMAVEKFEDFKVFSSTTEEMLTALGDALDATDGELHMARQNEQKALASVQEKEARIKELEGILAVIGVDLGIT